MINEYFYGTIILEIIKKRKEITYEK